MLNSLCAKGVGLGWTLNKMPQKKDTPPGLCGLYPSGSGLRFGNISDNQSRLLLCVAASREGVVWVGVLVTNDPVGARATQMGVLSPGSVCL